MLIHHGVNTQRTASAGNLLNFLSGPKLRTKIFIESSGPKHRGGSLALGLPDGSLLVTNFALIESPVCIVSVFKSWGICGILVLPKFVLPKFVLPKLQNFVNKYIIRYWHKRWLLMIWAKFKMFNC